jgi:hypothetical protein
MSFRVSIIVHEPYRIETLVKRVLNCAAPTTCRADVFLSDEGNALISEHLVGAVGARIVDHQNYVRTPRLALNITEATSEQFAPIEGNDRSQDLHGRIGPFELMRRSSPTEPRRPRNDRDTIEPSWQGLVGKYELGYSPTIDGPSRRRRDCGARLRHENRDRRV